MNWSLKLGSLFGIRIFVHWTFSLLIIWVLFVYLSQGYPVGIALQALFFVLSVFACVVLHECGHALCARYYGIGTRNITLLPIGGVARLERMPTRPKEEFWVAVAGPAVNVVLAALLFLVAWGTGTLSGFRELDWVGGNFVVKLMYVNLFLVAFNMLPAFPMDGGRVLRSLLATGMPYPRATRVAATVGQGMAIFFGLVGFFFNPFLILIALFVFLGATAESQMAQSRTALEGLKARDAMITRFRSLSTEDTLEDAVNQLLEGTQEDFPVFEEGELRGILLRKDLVRALTERSMNAPVVDVMKQGIHRVDSADDLNEIYQRLMSDGVPVFAVFDEEQFAGLLTRGNLGTVVMVNSARMDRKGKHRQSF